MSEGLRIYRFEVAFEPLFDLHELPPAVADKELLALGGARTLLVSASDLEGAREIAEITVMEVYPLTIYNNVSVECEHRPLSAHEEMILRQTHPKVPPGHTWWPDGAPE